MTARVRTTAQARRHMEKAGAWWRANRPAALTLLRDETAHALDLLAHAPDIGSPHAHPEIPGLRRLYLPGTRYHLYYVHDMQKAEVVILAVWSALRGRGPRLSGR